MRRRHVPLAVRLAWVRLVNSPRRLVQWHAAPRRRDSALAFPFVLAEQTSPLERELGIQVPHGEEAANIRAAARGVDGIRIEPQEVFSFYAAVGKPRRWRGFRPGLEVHGEKLGLGVGGGACKVASLIYRLALWGGMRIVERHRHALDLFPDKDRQVPFGCGATVYYNRADLRFENPLPYPVLLHVRIDGGHVVGELRTESDPGFRIDVYETGHRFFDRGGVLFRENRIRRTFLGLRGETIRDDEVAHNVARVMYAQHSALPSCMERQSD